MQRDLNVLGRVLGRSVDDAALTVHLVLHQMISLNGGQTGKVYCILMMRIVSVCYALRIFLLQALFSERQAEKAAKIKPRCDIHFPVLPTGVGFEGTSLGWWQKVLLVLKYPGISFNLKEALLFKTYERKTKK